MKARLGAAFFSSLLLAASLTAEQIKIEVWNLNKLAGERQKAHDWDSAERYYLRALDIATGSKANEALATLHENLGDLYTVEDRYTDAQNQLHISYDLLKTKYGEGHPKLARTLNKMGEVN